MLVRIDEEAIMNILLWYLPYAMFSGGCDVVPAESGTLMASERRADCAGREQETDDEAGRNDDEIQSRRRSSGRGIAVREGNEPS
jgi:hypothetical protein